MQTVLWSYDSHDWMLSHQSQPGMYLNYVYGNPEYDVAGQHGGIVLMHDLPRSDEMLDELLTNLEESNFVFVLPG
jgi:peptidoglycan/xylan/chitin deacetylase (PgdA/CDA1 family)